MNLLNPALIPGATRVEVRNIVAATAAAGQQVVLPIGIHPLAFLLLACQYVLVASVAAGSRWPGISVGGITAGNPIVSVAAQVAINPSVTTTVAFGLNGALSNSFGGSVIQVNLTPALMLSGGIATNVTNLDAADQISAFSGVVAVWLP